MRVEKPCFHPHVSSLARRLHGGAAAWISVGCRKVCGSYLLKGPEPPAEPYPWAACLSLSIQTYCDHCHSPPETGLWGDPEGDSLKEGAVGTYSICQGQLVE